MGEGDWGKSEDAARKATRFGQFERLKRRISASQAQQDEPLQVRVRLIPVIVSNPTLQTLTAAGLSI